LGQRFQIRSQTNRGEQIIEGWEFKPPGAQFDENMLNQEVSPTQPPTEQESVTAPADSVEAEESPPAPNLPQTQNAPPMKNTTQPSAQLASLGMAVALLRLQTHEPREHVSPARVAEAMDRLGHRGFSPSERRRRVAQRLCELTGQ
jgi:hypothetical protein